MNTPIPLIPENRIEGVRYIESLKPNGMKLWLETEVNEWSHNIAGGRDDQPVQAILNHAPYISEKARLSLEIAIEDYIMVWRNAPADGNPSAINHLLNLAAEIPVPKVKHLLQAMN